MAKAKFSSGQTVHFEPTGSDDVLKAHAGYVVIVRRLTSKEADLHDVGMMYRIEAPDGWTDVAFEDELTSKLVGE